MNYSTNPAMVRVDVFKPSGKWYETVAIKWLTWSGSVDSIHNVFRQSIAADPHARQYLQPYDEEGRKWILVCLEPYHEDSHPITLGLGYGH